MASLSSWFRRGAVKKQAQRLYDGAVAQARAPAFYRDGGAPDTIDGRFDLICLHVHLLLRRLAQEADPASRGLAQALYDVMFVDFDRCLREMGVSDVTLGRRIQEMTELFHGRMAAYHAGLDADLAAVTAAVRRNLFRGDPDAPAAAIGAYMIQAAAQLAATPFAAFNGGAVVFPEFVASAFAP